MMRISHSQLRKVIIAARNSGLRLPNAAHLWTLQF